MKKAIVALAAVALTAAAIGSASAADMPIVPKAPHAAVVFNWTGFYAGATAGWGWGRTNQIDSGGPSSSFRYDGFVGGLTAGYNWQSGAWVFGIETDFSLADISGSFPDSPAWGCGGSCHNKVEWFGTARGRLGYAFDRLLPYVTGGFAYGRVYGDFGSCAFGCIKGTESGWTAGAGLEWAFAPNWSAKLEYLFVDLGKLHRIVPGNDLGVDIQFNVIRGGVNWKF